MRALAVWINRLLWTFIVTVVVGVGALVALARHYIDYVDDYQQQIVAAVSEHTGITLQVERLSARWVRASPQFTLRNLTIFNPAKNTESVLHIDKLVVRVGLLPSLSHWQPVFSHVEGNGIRAELDETAGGRWLLRGFPGHGSIDPVIDALLRIHRAELRDANARLHFLGGRSAPVQAASLQLRRTGDFRRVQLALQVAPRSAPLTVQIEAHGDPRESAQFRARGYAHFAQVDLTPLLPLAQSQGVALTHGHIDGAAWLDWQGDTFSARGEVSLPQLDLAGLTGRAMAPLTQLSTPFLWRSDGAAQQLWLPRLRARWGEAPIELASLLLEHRRGDAHATLRAPQLDLADVQRVLHASALLPASVTEAFDQLDAHGMLHHVELQLPLRAPLAEQLRLRSEIAGLKMNAWHGAPGLSGINGFIDTGINGGSAVLDGVDAALDFPHVYHQPVPFAHLRGALDWQRIGDRIRVRSGPIDAASDAGVASVLLDLDLNLHPGDPVPPQMTLVVGMRNSAAQYRNYFVPYTLPQSLLDWLDHSIAAAALPRGGFIYRGSLRAGDHANRTVQLFLDVEDGELSYHPEWPALHALSADVWLDDAELDVAGRSARVFDDIALADIAVSMRPQPEGGEWLTVQGDARARDNDLLRLLRESPLQKNLQGALDHWEWQGAAHARLDLGIPIGGASGNDHVRAPEVRVEGELDGGTLALRDLNLTLTQVDGPLQYLSPARAGEKPGLQSPGLNAKLYGRPTKIRIDSDTPNITAIHASGRVDMANLRDWLQQPLLEVAQGETAFKLDIKLDGERSALKATSDLSGVAIELPPPYRKFAPETLPLQVAMPLRGDRHLTVALGDWADLGLIWAPRPALQEKAQDKPVLQSALLRLGRHGDAAPEVGRLVVTGTVPAVDLQPWRELLAKHRDELVGDTPEAVAGVAPRATAITLRDVVLPEVAATGMVLRDVHVSGEHTTGAEAGWHLRVQSPQLTGSAVIPDQPERPLQLDLATLRLPAAPVPTSEVPEQPAAPRPSPFAQLDPAAMPPADVSIRQLWRGDDNWGDIGFQLRPVENGLRFEQLRGHLRGIAVQPVGSVPARLVWQKQGGVHRTRFTGRLAVGDIGAVLERWRFEKSITSQQGHIDADIAWNGAPDEIGLTKLDGDAAISLSDGQFLKASGSATGALKVVGVFNFANLLRRLQLDFSDLFKDGVSFDSIDGALAMRSGVFKTRTPIDINSPSSHFRLSGQLDFNTDQTDMELVATLPVASNLPWVVALAGGLPAAAGVYLASKLFEEQVDHFSSAVYEISGPWREPTVKFRRLFDDELPKRPPPATAQTEPARAPATEAETRP